MTKRTERFCDFREAEPQEESSLAHTSRRPETRVNKEGGCVEAAVGQCIRCKRDFCDRHMAHLIGLELNLGSYHRYWKINLCRNCAQLQITEKFKLSKDEEKMVEELIKSLSQSFVSIGRPRRIPKPRVTKPPSDSWPGTPEQKLLRAIFGETPDGITPRSEVDGVTLKDAISSALSTVTEREAKILRMRFGFDHPLGTGQSLIEVGKAFDRTRERIRQIEGKGLRRLRHGSRSKHLKPYLGKE